jgi:hypothetical protein
MAQARDSEEDGGGVVYDVGYSPVLGCRVVAVEVTGHALGPAAADEDQDQCDVAARPPLRPG